jgi:hypothetical protein
MNDSKDSEQTNDQSSEKKLKELEDSEQTNDQSSEKMMKELEDMAQYEYNTSSYKIDALSEEIVSKLREFHTLVNDLKIKSKVHEKYISDEQSRGTAVQMRYSIYLVEHTVELIKGAAAGIPMYEYMPQGSMGPGLKRTVVSSLSKLFSYIW